MKSTEIAWFAGLFEGEGCISLPKTKSVSLKLKMTDRDVIDRINDLFPCPKIQVKTWPDHPEWKTQYGWNITKGEDIVRILTLIMPYLGERRKAKARTLLNFVQRRPGKRDLQCRKDPLSAWASLHTREHLHQSDKRQPHVPCLP